MSENPSGNDGGSNDGDLTRRLWRLRERATLIVLIALAVTVVFGLIDFVYYAATSSLRVGAASGAGDLGNSLLSVVLAALVVACATGEKTPKLRQLTQASLLVAGIGLGLGVLLALVGDLGSGAVSSFVTYLATRVVAALAVFVMFAVSQSLPRPQPATPQAGWGQQSSGQFQQGQYPQGQYPQNPYGQGQQGQQGQHPQNQYGQGQYPQNQHGQGQYGQAQSGQGQYAQGQSAQGQSAQGQSAQGQSAQGQSAQGQYAQGQYGQGQYAQGQYAQGEYAQGQYSEGQYPQHQYSQGQSGQYGRSGRSDQPGQYDRAGQYDRSEQGYEQGAGSPTGHDVQPGGTSQPQQHSSEGGYPHSGPAAPASSSSASGYAETDSRPSGWSDQTGASEETGQFNWSWPSSDSASALSSTSPSASAPGNEAGSADRREPGTDTSGWSPAEGGGEDAAQGVDSRVGPGGSAREQGSRQTEPGDGWPQPHDGADETRQLPALDDHGQPRQPGAETGADRTSIRDERGEQQSDDRNGDQGWWQQPPR